MKKAILFVLMVSALVLWGCIVSFSPQSDEVTIAPGENMTFEVNLFPESNGVSWSLDGEEIPGASENIYEYTSPMDDSGIHVLKVTMPGDCHQWNIRVISTSNPCVPDVPAAFDAVCDQGEKLAIYDDKLIPWPLYTQALCNGFGLDNHFQGIQRLRMGQYLAISGSDINNPPGDLFIVKMGSCPSSGPFKTDTRDIFGRDNRIVAAMEIGSELLWHPGGLSACGDILVVPVEEYKEAIVSKILFFDVSDPEHPIRFDHYIDRTEAPFKDKAGAVAMTRIENGRYLLAARSTSDTYFYLSRTSRFGDGFDSSQAVVWDEDNVQSEPGLDAGFGGSAFNFIQQCNGELFLVAFSARGSEASIAIPFLSREHWMYLYHIVFPGDDFTRQPVITRIAQRQMFCSDGGGDVSITPAWRLPAPFAFDAAAGIYITPDGQLSVYSSPHHRSAGIIRMAEFWSRE
ncbi:MAG: hypothetical protein U9P80_03195 [Thermodesulfobacteriota bacterium]|nr:hypothetical protein [Thermodesulfobacteriota bacterium]